MAERAGFAKVLSLAILDPDFADAVNESPEIVARSVGVRLNADQAKALKNLSPGEIASVSGALRDKLGPVAFVDQQQQQQARMD